MKVHTKNIGKILAKINIHEHALPICIIRFINVSAKTKKKYKETFNNNISETVFPIWLKFENYFFLCNSPISIFTSGFLLISKYQKI